MLLYQSFGIRRWIAALIGGGVGAVIWAYLMGFEGVELAKALGIGACALVTAELASGAARAGWRQGLLWGMTGGLVVAMGGLFFFAIEDGPRHRVVTMVSLTAVGLVASAFRQRSARKSGAL